MRADGQGGAEIGVNAGMQKAQNSGVFGRMEKYEEFIGPWVLKKLFFDAFGHAVCNLMGKI